MAPTHPLQRLARVPAEARRRSARALGALRFDERLVWILGSPRSGSTWLWQMLREHDHVVAINEPLIGRYLSPFASDQPSVDRSSLDLSNFTVRRLQRDRPVQFFAEEFADVWAPALGEMMRRRFLAHAQRYPASVPLSRTVVAIKEPNGSQSADVLLRAMPRSRLLFLLRDGRDVVDSHMAAIAPGAWLDQTYGGIAKLEQEQRIDRVVDFSQKWLWRTEVVQEAFAAHTSHKLLLRYEDLLEQPVAHLRALVEWLGLPVRDEWVEKVAGDHDFGAIPADKRGADKFFRAAQPGLWRENLSADEQDAMLAIIGPKLRELGYE